jgi:hypothetical protein
VLEQVFQAQPLLHRRQFVIRLLKGIMANFLGYLLQICDLAGRMSFGDFSLKNGKDHY